MVVGFAFSILLRFVLTPRFFNAIFSPAAPFSPREFGDLNIATTTGVLFAVSILWFFGSMLFYRSDDAAYVGQVNRFFADLRTPIDPAVEHGSEYASDSRQYAMLGNQCLVYGVFIYALLLIPNSAAARIAIVCCASLLAGSGALLKAIGRRLAARERAAASLLAYQ